MLALDCSIRTVDYNGSNTSQTDTRIIDPVTAIPQSVRSHIAVVLSARKTKLSQELEASAASRTNCQPRAPGIRTAIDDRPDLKLRPDISWVSNEPLSSRVQFQDG